jgi:hypothetical protein
MMHDGLVTDSQPIVTQSVVTTTTGPLTKDHWLPKSRPLVTQSVLTATGSLTHDHLLHNRF